MPHWFGLINTASPQILEGCAGDPEAVRERIYAEAPHGASVRSLHWLSGEDRAVIMVEGPAGQQYLEQLEAEDVQEHVNAQERKAQQKS
jgi:hypothetical protein